MNQKFSFYSKLILRLGRTIHKRISSYDELIFDNDACHACGNKSKLIMRGVLWPDLVLQWELNPAWANWIDQREGLRCSICHSNIRSRQLAGCLIAEINMLLSANATTLSNLRLIDNIHALKIAEINAAGDLHPFLSLLPNLKYSEYGSSKPDVPSEDLLNLSYMNESFDIVITSDVLEHVPDVCRALQEIKRVLKPNGLHIFTVPIVWYKRKSRCRAAIADNEIKNFLPQSHHGAAGDDRNDFLVFNEFGADFIELCKDSGFTVKLSKDPRNPSLVCIISQRL